jgi:hypothetical protein
MITTRYIDVYTWQCEYPQLYLLCICQIAQSKCNSVCGQQYLIPSLHGNKSLPNHVCIAVRIKEIYYLDLDSSGVVGADEMDCRKILAIETLAMVKELFTTIVVIWLPL